MPQASAVTDRPIDEGATVYGSIVKFEETPEGHLMVFGKATGSDLDGDQQRMSPKFLAKAMPEWMEFGNLREQHSKIAAGIGVELTQSDDADSSWMLKSLCVDEGTKEKIRHGVLKGYSINVLGARVTQGTPSAPNGEIVGGVIGEISYVDRPCLGSATISICKALGDDGTGGLEVADAPTEAELDELDDAGTDGTPLVDDDDESGDDLVVQVADLRDEVGEVAKSLGELTSLIKALKLPGAAPAKTPPVDQGSFVASLTKAFGDPDVAKAVGDMISDQIDLAVSKAQAESGTVHEAEIASLRTDLEKALARPMPGAPIIVGAPRTTSDPSAVNSRKVELLNKAARRDLDPVVAAAYRRQADAEPDNA